MIPFPRHILYSKIIGVYITISDITKTLLY